jgi:copper resistance protein D
MNALLVAARAVHFGSALLLFGELVLAFAVTRELRRDGGDVISRENGESRKRLFVVMGSGIIVGVVSGSAWLALEAAMMSGLPIEQAMNRDALGVVLGQTVFGHTWVLRFTLVIALAALLVALVRTANDRNRSRLALAAIFVAGLYLAALAWVGHATAAQGPEHFPQTAFDVIHLLAAGAWLGALPGLVYVLGSRPALNTAARVVRRFSLLGLVSVGALLLTGIANTWFLVGSVSALVGTEYGWLLLTKLTLFTAMIALATVNRLRLTPRLQRRDHRALALLRRNAILEIAAGIMVIVIVGVLGITVPAAHQSPTGHSMRH